MLRVIAARFRLILLLHLLLLSSAPFNYEVIKILFLILLKIVAQEHLERN